MLHALFEAVTKPGRVIRRIRRRAEIRRLAMEPTRRVVIGASGMVPPSWIGTEIDDVNLLAASTWERFFSEDSIDAILAEHVWEHLTRDDGLVAAKNCYRFLKPGGRLRVAVPDGNHPDADYIQWVRPGGVGPGCDDHKVLYTNQSFSDLFQQAGFDAQLLEYFEVDGKFQFRDWNPEDGMIRRSSRFDHRNEDGQLRYTSIILDAVKPNRTDQAEAA